jgi:hypothetical protein
MMDWIYRQLGVAPPSSESLRPSSEAELLQRQLNQAASMRAMTEEELALRYGGGLANAYHVEDAKQKRRA